LLSGITPAIIFTVHLPLAVLLTLERLKLERNDDPAQLPQALGNCVVDPEFGYKSPMPRQADPVEIAIPAAG
jgi:hypothetical protein